MAGSGCLSDNECIALLQWMLRHDTTAQQSREAGFVTELSRYLAARSIPTAIRLGDEGRANLVATLDSGRTGPHLVLRTLRHGTTWRPRMAKAAIRRDH
ncbi:hypothetical protein HGG76_20000 [Ochrobactrum tritici]|uniref:Uncharacterized protein n=1 Tax=Brucella tritici TaxID=94626 RepID=A0A7X6FRK5_9HYPH|nr:hypothetical protein [Brucella tritici]